MRGPRVNGSARINCTAPPMGIFSGPAAQFSGSMSVSVSLCQGRLVVGVIAIFVERQDRQSSNRDRQYGHENYIETVSATHQSDQRKQGNDPHYDAGNIDRAKGDTKLFNRLELQKAKYRKEVPFRPGRGVVLPSDPPARSDRLRQRSPTATPRPRPQGRRPPRAAPGRARN